jgi:hypothetical protein
LITIGDYIVLFSALITAFSLFLPWFTSSTPGTQSQKAFAYSEVASVIVLVFFLTALFLVIYPAISPDAGLPPLPFSTPVVLLTMGAILVLIFTYELGKYDCIQCGGISRGYGVWVGLIASLIFIVGSVIKWGSRPSRMR